MYEWNGYVFETKMEMINFANSKTKADELDKVYSELYDDTSAFYNVKQCHKYLASYLIDDINKNYKAFNTFYNAQYVLNKLISIL